MDLVLDFHEEIDHTFLTRSVCHHNFRNEDDRLCYAQTVLDEIIDALVEERRKENALDQ